MNVATLLATTSSEELTRWQAFFELQEAARDVDQVRQFAARRKAEAAERQEHDQ
ncbi:MAG: hypothetical protein ACEQSH_00490 [Bacteroidia bacterium]